MSKEFTFDIKSTRFDENYRPADSTRLTTNFANLARGERRRENLRNALIMIDKRFNALAHWDNPEGDRYSVELDIISVEANVDIEGGASLPLIEILKTSVFVYQRTVECRILKELHAVQHLITALCAPRIWQRALLLVG